MTFVGDEAMDEVDLEYLESELLDEEQDADAFSPVRLVGVAMFGALVSLGAYYVYQTLEPEKKANLKKKASGMIQEQIHALTEIREDDED